jgi:hypothetical protein
VSAGGAAVFEQGKNITAGQASGDFSGSLFFACDVRILNMFLKFSHCL